MKELVKMKDEICCKYCQKGARLEDEYANYEAEVVKITPLPVIDLTIGEKADTADPPYYALFLYEDPEGGETASFPINFCPVCGRDLRSDKATEKTETDVVCRKNVIFELYKAALEHEIDKDTFILTKKIVNRARRLTLEDAEKLAEIAEMEMKKRNG